MKRFLSFALALVLLVSLVPVTASSSSTMKASGNIMSFIKSKEGCVLTAYKVPGESFYTIGYGHTGNVSAGDSITQAEADKLFAEDLKEYEAAVNVYADNYGLKLSQNQFDALVSFTYNCGINWINTSWRIARYLKANFKDSDGNAIPDQEIADAFGVICNGEGGIYPGLIKRRIEEAKIFLYGDYDGTGSHDFVYVLLDANGGSLTNGNKIVIYTKGQHYSSMPEATKSGYYLYGWKTSGGTYYTNSSIASSNLNLTAVWKEGTAPTRYSVTVTGGYGTGKNKAGATVYLSPYEKSGYSFTGWTTSSGVTISKDSDGYYYFTMPKTSVTITANFKKIQSEYELKVVNGGGSGTYKVGETVYIYPLSSKEMPGYKISKWTTDNSSVKVKGSATTGYYFNMPASDVTVTGVYVAGCNRFDSCPSLSYGDVSETHWAHSEIDYCIDNRFMTGTSSKTFEPEMPLTKAMAATILYRIAGNLSVDGVKVSYVDIDGEYFTKAVKWAVSKNITVAEKDNPDLFNPDEIVTREEFSVYLMRFASYMGIDIYTSSGASLSDFSDYTEISEQCLQSMELAVEAGIIKGTDEGTLEPQLGTTRAEAATMLYRLMQSINV